MSTWEERKHKDYHVRMGAVIGITDEDDKPELKRSTR